MGRRRELCQKTDSMAQLNRHSSIALTCVDPEQVALKLARPRPTLPPKLSVQALSYPVSFYQVPTAIMSEPVKTSNGEANKGYTT